MSRTLPATAGLHVAIIMDGNGRWATRRGLPRTAGHRAGVEAVRRVIESAPDLGIRTLTLFAFASANWRRPPEEVTALMRLLQVYMRAETRRFVGSGARLTVIGRRDRLRPRLMREIEDAERATCAGGRLHVRIALDYSSRESIARAAARCAAESPEALDRFGQLVSQSTGDEPETADVDLLIRTGGEQRLSDFLLWECAFAELWFTERMWPEFGAEDLRAAVLEFHRRERRFGGLGNAAPDAAVARLATG
ncbi:MAG TPA: di-trans,poly-cis-decaprenylcistransferase [Stellaceae bacterium]|nr:di-trans,poly-cis-decaprenylcistransferase [Stellaceae bacterium]